MSVCGEDCLILNIAFIIFDNVSIICRTKYPVRNAISAYRYGSKYIGTLVISNYKPKKLPVLRIKYMTIASAGPINNLQI